MPEGCVGNGLRGFGVELYGQVEHLVFALRSQDVVCGEGCVGGNLSDVCTFL